MARLNDPPQSGNDSLEAVKKRYIRQNREIARVNSTQSIRIRSLESETTRLLSENIELREQVIKLQSSLDKRDQNKVVVENVEATKRQLEGKVVEMQELLKSLGQAISFSPQVKAPPKQKAYIVSPEQRTWKSGLSFSEVMGTEGSLPAISEDARSRRNSLNADENRQTSLGGDESRRSSLNIDENRRNSINFEEITLLPTPQLDDAESDEDLKPPVSSLLDIRPRRRRRDSALPIQLEASKPAAPPKTQSQTAADSVNGPTKPKKRRYEDRDQAQDTEPHLDLDFKFTRLSQRTTNMTKQQTEIQRPPVALIMLDGPEEEELNDIEKIVQAGRRAVKPDPVEPKELVPTRETVTSNAAPTMGRRALGPKSTNSDPSNSPLKQAAIKSNLLREGDLEKLEKPEFDAPPRIKPYDSKTRGTGIPPIDTDTSTSRPSRRTKASVNYALPNLRDKMRRNDKFDEPPKGEGKAPRRAMSGGRLRSKDSIEELVTRQEEFDDVEGIVGKQWFDLPILPHATLAVDAGEEPRKIKDTGIGGLLERKPNWENDLDQVLPASVVTHRKRRSSGLRQSSVTNLLHDGTNGRVNMSQIAIPTESKRKTVSFDPPNITGSEEGQSRNHPEDASLRRKQIVHSHLPPSSMHTNIGEASAALNEVLRGSRRVTLGGAAKGIRSTKSNSNLIGDDETELENRLTSELGTANRRRSMML